MARGKLIVIDGIDGSGKATQTKMLAKRLKREGIKIKTIDFPRYYDNFFGHMIGQCLSGLYGDFTQIEPRLASVLYAADRFETSPKIKTWLEAGYIVLADRYVSSNSIHQGGKIKNLKKRIDFISWLEKMEYKVFKIPKPNLVIFLDVPYLISKKWLTSKTAQKSKKYLQGKKDVVEENLNYLKRSRESALWLTKTNSNWSKVECCSGAVCLNPEDVHQLVYKIVKAKIK